MNQRKKKGRRTRAARPVAEGAEAQLLRAVLTQLESRKEPPAPAPRPAPAEEPLLELPEVLTVTHWFEPAPEPSIQRATVRISGQRVGAADRFGLEETIDNVPAGSGPVAITSKIHGLAPGEWSVAAEMIRLEGADRVELPRRAVHPAAWSWWRWKLLPGLGGPVRTRPGALSVAPGLVLGSWLGLVLLAGVVALVMQSTIIAVMGLGVDHALRASLLSILAGVIGAKIWYEALHRRRGWTLLRILQGWCVQGFVAGVVVTAPVILALAGDDIGAFFDASAPGLVVGMAIGRLGCFFTGCCTGRPTASRFGVWSSDRRLGLRRVPAQLMEAALGFAVGTGALVAMLTAGPFRGGLMIAALAAYTLGRQGLLRLRAERRRSTLGGPIVAGTAALILLLDVIALTAL